MRIGVGTTLPHENPHEWARLLHDWGCTTAVCPVDATASSGVRDEYLREAQRYGLSIGEVGVWRNVMSPEPQERDAAISYAEAQLALAEAIGAGCCLNISGNAGPGGWDQYSPENYSEESYERLVETTREIIDAVHPTRTYYAIECMPWMLPDSPESYLRLLADINRPQLRVHLDYTNMVNGVPRWRHLRQFIQECFTQLGPHIVSVHAKDIRLDGALPVTIGETQPGTGSVDFALVLRLAAALPGDTTLYTEHLDTIEEYRDAVAFLRRTASEAGIAA